MLWLWGSMGKGGNKVWLMFLPEISTEPCHYPIWRGGPKGQNKRLYNLQVWLGNVILMSWKVPTNSYSKRKSKASEPPLEVTLRDPKKKKWRVKWPRDPLSTSLSDHVIKVTELANGAAGQTILHYFSLKVMAALLVLFSIWTHWDGYQRHSLSFLHGWQHGNDFLLFLQHREKEIRNPWWN